MPEEFQPYFYKKPQGAQEFSLVLLFGICFVFLGMLSFGGSYFSGKLDSSPFLYFLVGIFAVTYDFFKRR